MAASLNRVACATVPTRLAARTLNDTEVARMEFTNTKPGAFRSWRHVAKAAAWLSLCVAGELAIAAAIVYAVILIIKAVPK